MFFINSIQIIFFDELFDSFQSAAELAKHHEVLESAFYYLQNNELIVV